VKGLVVRGVLLKCALGAVVLWSSVTGSNALARAPVDSFDIAPVALSSLPQEGRETYRLIHLGGPFPYEKDGVVFGNRERLLPGQKRGYYREYTVKTPNVHHRGTRRIVCGGAKTTPNACFYTADHYASFRRIVP
jgi:ribonuclease T1